MIDPIETAMMKVRIRLLLEQPLFGQMILHLEMQDASSWCPTAATDGRKLYYNREFIKSLTNEELLFVHGHEVLHVILDHIYRRGDRDKGYWNSAIDYITNFILKQAGIGKMPKNCLYNENYTDEFSAEELYDLLIRQGNQAPQPMDMHLEADGDGGVNSQQGGPPKLSAAEIADIRETIQTALAQAAQNTEPGKIPAGISRLLNRLHKPKFNWRQMLTATLRSAIKFDHTYTRLSRRSWSSGLILPGQDVMDRIDVIAWLDGSGSTTQEMVTDFLSECQGILQQFRDFSLTIGTFDTEPYNVQTFTPNNATEIKRYEFNGGGGTMPSCCWTYMKEHKLKPNKLLVFTDGMVGDDWGEPGFADTLFIVHSNTIIAPYGRTVLYE